MSFTHKKLPNIVETLLNLDDNQINLISDNILVNLTHAQLREIHISKKINYTLIERIRNTDKQYFKNNILRT